MPQTRTNISYLSAIACAIACSFIASCSEKQDNATLQRLTEAEKTITRLREDLAVAQRSASKTNDSPAQVQALEGEIIRLRRQLQQSTAPSNQSSSDLSARINALKRAFDAETADLREENRQLKTEIKRLKGGSTAVVATQAETTKTPGVPSKRNSLKQGSKEQALFASLVNFDSISGKSVNQRYRNIETKHQVVQRTRIGFSAGSSRLGKIDLKKIRAATLKSKESSRFLVISYEDMTGTLEEKRDISMTRANAIVDAIRENRPGVVAEALYFGQTDRFGKQSKNRTVEIWEIRR